MVVTQSSTSHQLLCVQLYECVCVSALVFCITAHLGNEIIVITNHQIAVNYCNVILSSSVPETVSIREINLRNVAEAGARTRDL